MPQKIERAVGGRDDRPRIIADAAEAGRRAAQARQGTDRVDRASAEGAHQGAVRNRRRRGRDIGSAAVAFGCALCENCCITHTTCRGRRQPM